MICTGGPRPTATVIEAPEGLEGILVIPEVEVSTRKAPRGDPGTDPDQGRGRQHGLRRPPCPGPGQGDSDLIGMGLHDRLHQERRRHLPEIDGDRRSGRRDRGDRRDDLGAGPTVLVWTNWQETGEGRAAEGFCEGWAEVRRVDFQPLGADVPEL